MLRMGKEWILADKLSTEYRNGVNEFLQFSLDHATNANTISCPCLHCGNLHKLSIGKIKEYLFFNEIDRSYKVWFWHGEKILIRKTPSR